MIECNKRGAGTLEVRWQGTFRRRRRRRRRRKKRNRRKRRKRNWNNKRR